MGYIYIYIHGIVYYIDEHYVVLNQVCLCVCVCLVVCGSVFMFTMAHNIRTCKTAQLIANKVSNETMRTNFKKYQQ